MNTFELSGDWLIVRMAAPNLVLTDLLYSVIFRQTLQPPHNDGECAIILEGRPMVGADGRLRALGVLPRKRVRFGAVSKMKSGARATSPPPLGLLGA